MFFIKPLCSKYDKNMLQNGVNAVILGIIFKIFLTDKYKISNISNFNI